jgi:hypothetical protein
MTKSRAHQMAEETDRSQKHSQFLRQVSPVGSDTYSTLILKLDAG